jgi:23S rRNA (adenine2503-C2)-methyltransferase
LVNETGYSSSYAGIIANSVYKRKTANLLLDKKIPPKLARLIMEICDTDIIGPERSESSADGSIKYIYRNKEGLLFESVFIPEPKRKTVCVSVQSGCRMGCPFCATSSYGFHGNLDAGDIVNQVLGIPGSPEVTHIVFMGMGEPLDNRENLFKAIEIFTSDWGMSISPANITVSTVGIYRGVKDFLSSSKCNLTLSLFSPFSDERIRVVPAEKKNPASDIISLMKEYPLRRRRRLSIAYVMIKDINDSDRHLEALIKMISVSGIRINLLPFHRTGDESFFPSPAERISFFRERLSEAGIPATIRKSRGSDIFAACGLLAGNIKDHQNKF